MIIRLTVNDNDFTQVLEKYLNNKIFNLTLDLMDKAQILQEKREANKDDEKVLKAYNDAMSAYADAESKLREIFNVNSHNQLTTEEKDFLKERLQTSFDYYIKRYNKPQELVGKLKVKVSDSFTDKWENGEVVYWLQSSNTLVIQ